MKISSFLSGLSEKIKKIKNSKAIKPLVTLYKRSKRHDIAGMAAKTTYHLFISFFPLAILLLSAVANSGSDLFEYIMPPFVLSILDEVIEVAPENELTAISLIISIWSSSTAIWALMDGIRTIYIEKREESENEVNKKSRVKAVLFTVILAVSASVCVSLTIFSNAAIEYISLKFAYGNVLVLYFFRMLIVMVYMFLFTVSLYSLSSGKKAKKFKNVYIGAVISSVVWVFTSWIFEIYMKLFNKYSLLYGSIGAFLGLALWLYIVSLVIFLGAEINSIFFDKEANFN